MLLLSFIVDRANVKVQRKNSLP